ncbi:MAG: hypothetical protein R3D86_05875 [Emcibacteraceae bacterium]
MSAVEDLSQERRITFCLYEYWEKLAGESGLPALKNMNRNEIAPFKKNLVLLDLRNGQDNPTFQVIGQDLMEDLDEDLTNKPVKSVPRRTMLSRVTDHYMEVLANRVPIAFEAEFVNKEGEKALYRGILLPFSDDNKNINFILGGVRWILEKDVTLDDTKPTIEELMRQIAQGREDYEPESEQDYETAATADEETAEFAEAEFNDEFLETDVTDEVSEQEITAEDEMFTVEEITDEVALSDFDVDINAETETAENDDDILALDIEAEDEDENFASTESEIVTDELDLGDDDFSSEIADEEGPEKAALLTPEYEHITENEDLLIREENEEAFLSSEADAEAEIDNSHILEAEPTYDETEGLSGNTESAYQSASTGGLRRKVFLPMEEQTEISKSDLDEEDEIMLSETDNLEELEEVTESGHHEDNLSSFSALVDAIQNREDDTETAENDLIEAEFSENDIERWAGDIEDQQNPDQSETLDADNSASEEHHSPNDSAISEEENVLTTVSDEEIMATEESDLQQDDFDDEIDDILELTEMAEEDVLSDDSGEPSFITDFDENKEIKDFLDVEDSASFEDDFINELTSEPQIDEKPKTLESLLAEDIAVEEFKIENTNDLNKIEDTEDHEIEAAVDIGSDFEVSEPEELINEENITEDVTDQAVEDLVPSSEEEHQTTVDVEQSDSRADYESADDDDLSIEELMQSIIAERKFDQAYIREQALHEEQKQNEDLANVVQNEENIASAGSLSEEIVSEDSFDADSHEDVLISTTDPEDEVLCEEVADIDIATANETMLEEVPSYDEIDTPAPIEETDITFSAEVTPDQSLEILDAGEQEIYVEFDDALKHSMPSDSDLNSFEVNEIATVQPYKTGSANLASTTASEEIADTKAEKPKRRGSVIERAMERMSPRTIRDKSDNDVAEQVLGRIEALENIEPASIEIKDPIDASQEHEAEPKLDDFVVSSHEIAFEEYPETEDDIGKTETVDEFSALVDQIDEPVVDFIEPPSDEYETLSAEFEPTQEQEKEDFVSEQSDELETKPVIEDQIDSMETAKPEIESSETEETQGQTLPQLRDTLKQVVGYIKKEDANHNRSRDSLYNILTAIYEFYDICEKSSDAFETIVKENDLKIQDRAPYTPVLKICLGKDYDKTRLTEYAAALGIGHYMNVDVSEFHAFIKNFPGGIKGCVKEMRNIRKHGASGNITARKTRTVEEAREILRDMAPIASFRLKKVIVGNNVDEFCLLLAKRDGHDINVLKVLDDKYTKLEPILKRAAFIKGNLNDRK